ncbi:MAG: TolC family protein [Bacteroidota bacterium]
MKKFYFFIAILLIFNGYSQPFTQRMPLEELYQAANSHYPLIKDAGLIDNLEAANLAVITRGALPKISWQGQGQVQSENINLPLGTTILEAPLETWSTYLNIDYNLYNGGLTKAQKKIEAASAEVDRNALEVQLRKLKDQINTLVFAVSLSRKQQQILQNSRNDLATNIQTLQAAYDNGIALESEVATLKVRELELTSDIVALAGDINTYFLLLEQLTGRTLPKDVQFELPYTIIGDATNIRRPENELFESQKSLFTAQEASVAANTLPKISLFAQGGVGDPNPLNFSDFSTTTFALGGIRLNWNFLDFGKGKKEKQRLKIQTEQIEVDKELFLFDIESRSREYREQIRATKLKIANKTDIVTLQKSILNQTKVQLDNGVINANDYVTQLNATLNAEQELEFNKTQLQQLQIEYLTLLGQL